MFTAIPILGSAEKVVIIDTSLDSEGIVTRPYQSKEAAESAVVILNLLHGCVGDDCEPDDAVDTLPADMLEMVKALD